MNSPRNAVLVAGSANVDFVVRASHVPAPGETVLGREFATFPGGKGANQAVACARAGGARTRMLLALGEDPSRRSSKIRCAERGRASCTSCARRRESTGIALICLSDDAQNAITVAPGANARCVAPICPIWTTSPSCCCSSRRRSSRVEHARARRAPRREGHAERRAGARSCRAKLLDAVDVLVVNEDELTSGRRVGAASIAEALAAVNVPCAIVTLGARGAVRACRRRIHHAAGFEVAAGRHDRRGRHVLRRARRGAVRGAALPEALAPRERRRSARDHAARRAVEHPGV